METWTIANQKGGVGKTTTTVTLAGLLSARGQKTLLVDMDPHGSLTTYLGYDPDQIESSVYDLYQEDPTSISGLIRRTNFQNLDLLPASTAMATLDRQLGSQQGKGLVLKKALHQVTAEYQHVLIDCPPMLGVLMVNALAASEHLIIPVQTEFLALKGLERMLRSVKMMNHARSQPLPYTIVPTMFDKRTRASNQSLQTLKERHADTLWDLFIPVDTQFREASRAGIPASIMAPHTRGVQAYKALLYNLIVHKPDQFFNSNIA
ncbi:MAG: ParA family protein [Gammaproteobacteria bacterium]